MTFRHRWRIDDGRGPDPLGSIWLQAARLTGWPSPGTTVDGGLVARSLNGYLPQVGDSFVIATFANRLGSTAFDTVQWQGQARGVLVAEYHQHERPKAFTLSLARSVKTHPFKDG